MQKAIGLMMALAVLTAPAWTAEAKKAHKKPAQTAEEAEAKKAAAEAAAAKAREEAMVVRNFAPGSAEATLRDMVHCGVDVKDEAAAFDCYLKLQMVQNRDTETAVTQLKHYSWKVFRSRADSYPVTPVPTTDKDFALKIARREPEKCDVAAKQCKFFLISRVRDMPAPVTLQYEEGAWRIYMTSL